jgi:pyrimidine oxygenase
VDIGVFIPINNNGWIISATSPQYMPSFELNKSVVLKAERYGLDFALSMIKLHGFGGKTEFWDHGLESFTLMAGLASVTARIRLYASVAVLTIPPAIVARMASTIADISGGRFGVNIVSGWHKIEYSQMGVWPGDDHFGKRYDYSTEYMRVMQELWTGGHSDFRGEYFKMDACKLSPRPVDRIKLVAAGQSDRGMEFAAQYCDFNFALGEGVNEPTKAAAVPARMLAHADKDRARCRKLHALHDHRRRDRRRRDEEVELYNDGADLDALAHLLGKAAEDSAPSATSMASAIQRGALPINFNMGTLVGSYTKVARMLDEAAEMPGVKGIMLTFDDFLLGMDDFGTRIQPLMRCREGRVSGAVLATGG